MHLQVWECMTRAYMAPYRIESNYAREYRFAVAFAASVGWLSVVHPDGQTYGRDWHITAEGLFALTQHHSETTNGR